MDLINPSSTLRLLLLQLLPYYRHWQLRCQKFSSSPTPPPRLSYDCQLRGIGRKKYNYTVNENCLYSIRVCVSQAGGHKCSMKREYDYDSQWWRAARALVVAKARPPRSVARQSRRGKGRGQIRQTTYFWLACQYFSSLDSNRTSRREKKVVGRRGGGRIYVETTIGLPSG